VRTRVEAAISPDQAPDPTPPRPAGESAGVLSGTQEPTTFSLVRWLPLLSGGLIGLLLAIIGASLWVSREAQIQAATRTTRNLALVLEAQTAQTLDAVDATLSGFAHFWEQVPPSGRPSRAELHKLLLEKVRDNPYVRSIYILDAKGTMVHDSQALPARGLNFADRQYFQVHEKADNGLHVSNMMRGRLTGRWGLVLTRRLSNPGGTFAGVIVAALEPSNLELGYSGIDIGRDGLINLRHVDGDLIIRVPAYAGTVGQKIPSTGPLMEQIRQNGLASGWMESKFDHVERLYTARKLPDAPLIVFVGLSRDEILAPWNRLALTSAVLAAALVGSILWFTRRLLAETRERDALFASLAGSERLLRDHRDHLQDAIEQRTHELLDAKNAAEAANRSKSEFLANISHELRTPMHAILSFARLGQDRKAEDPAAFGKMHQYFGRIHQSGERLLRLLNDLLDLSKLEAGAMVYDMRSHDLRSLVEEVVTEFSALANAKSVRIAVAVSEPAPIVVCDPARMGQVVRNLVSNAVKFSPADGVVRIDFSAASLPAGAGSTPRPAVLLTVSDEGQGIPEDELQAVFDKFVQSSKTKNGAGGTGLGLSICREIVRHHGGQIWARNGTQGAIFSVTVPLAPAAEALADAA
jgi:signal transduction histidine kinase